MVICFGGKVGSLKRLKAEGRRRKEYKFELQVVASLVRAGVLVVGGWLWVVLNLNLNHNLNPNRYR